VLGPAFDNPDFVDVVIHSYRHRHGRASSSLECGAAASCDTCAGTVAT